LQEELRRALENESKFDCLMLKTPMKKSEKSMSMPVAFLVFFDSVYAILMLILFPIWESEIAVYLSLFMGM
jgi:hypothetical protein